MLRWMTFDSVHILIVRAWLEPHPTTPLRATVRWTTGDGVDGEHSARLAGADAITSAVAAWLGRIEGETHP